MFVEVIMKRKHEYAHEKYDSDKKIKLSSSNDDVDYNNKDIIDDNVDYMNIDDNEVNQGSKEIFRIKNYQPLDFHEEVSLCQKDEKFPDIIGDAFMRRLFHYLDPKSLCAFSQASKQMANWTLLEREKNAASKLLLDVVQGNEAEAQCLLKTNPGLLCSTKGTATSYSGQHIRDLTPFQAALCAGDVEMCEMMKDFFYQIEDGQEKLEEQFNAIFPNGFEAHISTQQENVFDFKEILQAIIDAPDNEVTVALEKNFDNNLPLHRALEKFRKEFAEKSLSETLFNPYHLSQAFKMYEDEFNILGDWKKRDLFWCQIIGFVQRYLPACMLQAFAQGLCYITVEKKPLRPCARPPVKHLCCSILPTAAFGLGYDFAVCSGGRLCSRGLPHAWGLVAEFCRNKNIKLWRITQPIVANTNLVCNSLK